MRELVLDGAAVHSREALHEWFAGELELPEYYGRNVDALFDCLTGLCVPTRLVVARAEALRQELGAYGSLVLEALADAAAENEQFELAFVDEA